MQVWNEYIWSFAETGIKVDLSKSWPHNRNSQNRLIRDSYIFFLFYIFNLYQVCPKSQCLSTVATRKNLFRREIKETPLVDFFSGVRNIELTRDLIELPEVSLNI